MNLSDGSGLHALASFRVLATMCHPRHPGRRRRLLNLLKAETGAGTARGAGLTSDAFLREIQTCDGRLSGALLLNLLQLAGNKRRPSLNNAILMVQGVLEPWEMPSGPHWHQMDFAVHPSRRRAALLQAFNNYLSVSHLWAALLHAQKHGRRDIWPGDPSTLPRFLACADALAEMASKVRWSGHDRRFLLPRNVPWHFPLPEHLREHADLDALPLEPEQESALDTPRA